MKTRTTRPGRLTEVFVLVVFFSMLLSCVEKKIEGPPPPPPPPPQAAPAPPAEEAPPPPVGSPSPPAPDPLGAVDQILERLEFGNIAFNAPRSMDIDNTAMIQLMLGLAAPIDNLTRMIAAEGEKVGARIRVSDRMEARLTGPNFAITTVTPEIQAVSRSGITEWKWEVKPTSKGRQYLHLTLSAILTVDGASTPRAIRTFDKIIEVEVSWPQQVRSFLLKNWQWLWTALLVPLAGWLWKRRRSK